MIKYGVTDVHRLQREEIDEIRALRDKLMKKHEKTAADVSQLEHLDQREKELVSCIEKHS